MAEELLLSRYERAWNLHDPAGCAACFTEEGAREFRTRRPRAVRGRRAIARAAAHLMSAVPDLRVEVVSVGYCSDRRLWTEWRLDGTRADGRGRVALLGASVFRLSNAGFEEERVYWDPASAGAPPRISRARRARS